MLDRPWLLQVTLIALASWMTCFQSKGVKHGQCSCIAEFDHLLSKADRKEEICHTFSKPKIERIRTCQ